MKSVGDLLLDLLADKVTGAVAASVAVKSWCGSDVPETRGLASLVVDRQLNLAGRVGRLGEDESVVRVSAVGSLGWESWGADCAGDVGGVVSRELEVNRVDGSGLGVLAEEEFGDGDSLDVGGSILGNSGRRCERSGGKEGGDGDELHIYLI